MAKIKTYSVTYKVYPNTKIRTVPFHGIMKPPLYIQLIFDRRNTEYKSNLFNLFQQPKYGIRVAGELHAPPMDEIIRREEKLVEYVIDKYPDNFSFELFKKEYDYYSRDLLQEMEPGFIKYLHTFFQDEGMPYLADALPGGIETSPAFGVVRDFKRSLKPDLYLRLIDHSFDYSPPYLPLAQFAEEWRRGPLTSILVMDWLSPETQQDFRVYMQRTFPEKDVMEVISEIENYTKR